MMRGKLLRDHHNVATQARRLMDIMFRKSWSETEMALSLDEVRVSHTVPPVCTPEKTVPCM